MKEITKQMLSFGRRGNSNFRTHAHFREPNTRYITDMLTVGASLKKDAMWSLVVMRAGLMRQ
jgi:hypothetical protein